VSQVIAHFVVERILEADPPRRRRKKPAPPAAAAAPEDIDWSVDPEDPDTPGDIGKHADTALNADWRWRAWYDLKDVDEDVEMPDINSTLPDEQDEIEMEIHGRTYTVFRNEEAAEAKALAQVTDDLNNEPGNFAPDWLRHHINTERLTDILWEDQENMLREQHSSDEEWRDFLIDNSKLERDDFYGEDGDELPIDRNLEGTIENAKDAWIEDCKDNFDGLAWLGDIYGKDEIMAKAIEIAGINIEEAAADALRTDGWAHFISRYDGNYETLPGGAVYFRNG